MPTSPTPIDAAPTTPDRADRATFPTRMYAFFGYIKDTFVAAINALSTNVYDNAVIAYNSAVSSAADAIATAADRVQTGLDRTAAANSAASAAAIAGAFVGTSTSSLAVGTGSKTFATQAGEQYSAGIWMTAVSQGNPANWMFGQVTSYSGTTLILDVQATGGSGTHADWNLSLTGARGAPGAPGTLSGDATGNISMAGYALNESRGSVAMHATTMDLWAQPNIIDGTGSAVTVTAVANAPQAGARRVLYPVAASVITNGATFAVDGAANHTAAAGDQWEFEAITTSTYRVHVVKKDGTAVVAPAGGSWVYLSTVNANGSATVDITSGFSATYDNYAVVGSDIRGSALGYVKATFRLAGVYATGNNYYGNFITAGNSAALTGNALNGTPASYRLIQNFGNGAQDSAGFVAYLFNTNSARAKTMTSHAISTAGGTTEVSTGGVTYFQTNVFDVLDGLRLEPQSGTLSGTFRLYGIKNS